MHSVSYIILLNSAQQSESIRVESSGIRRLNYSNDTTQLDRYESSQLVLNILAFWYLYSV